MAPPEGQQTPRRRSPLPTGKTKRQFVNFQQQLATVVFDYLHYQIMNQRSAHCQDAMSRLRDVALGKAFLLHAGDSVELFDYCEEDASTGQNPDLIEIQ